MTTTPHDDTTRESSRPQAEPALDPVSSTALRAPAVRRLLALRAERRLTRVHVHTTARCLGVSERTVWRWLADATTTPATAASPGARRSDRFEITPDIRVLPAYWRGNASAVHRELVARARTATGPGTPAGDPAAPASPPHRPGGMPREYQDLGSSKIFVTVGCFS
ncbi:helix-turn-helix domain-containing protein [Embleya sp. NPDC059237]|uniref:helix-turn-helix domain-containing protein n=1 Tax=Embleya sp. NPDC059237 TaxID=3346784 RepID=UPI00369BCD85